VYIIQYNTTHRDDRRRRFVIDLYTYVRACVHDVCARYVRRINNVTPNVVVIYKRNVSGRSTRRTRNHRRHFRHAFVVAGAVFALRRTRNFLFSRRFAIVEIRKPETRSVIEPMAGAPDDRAATVVPWRGEMREMGEKN